jgi:coenzyme F420-reducing hydrogenase gamma subunit
MKARIAVHKFASCDGCQLAFLNAGEDLLALARLADIVHFAEAGPVAPDAAVDVAFVEGSVSTPDDIERIRRVRANSRFLITIGACATAGGVQALRNIAAAEDWIAEVYATPNYIDTLTTSTAIAHHVKVDVELWGCPVNTRQVFAALRSLLSGVLPSEDSDKVCLECKRRQAVCVMVARGVPCMGPVTRTGCGAICPAFGRDCYACYGPAETVNDAALGGWFQGLGLSPGQVVRRFRHINNDAPAFREAAQRLLPSADGGDGSGVDPDS